MLVNLLTGKLVGLYVWCHAAEALCSANILVFSPAWVGKAIMSVTHTAMTGSWLYWLSISWVGRLVCCVFMQLSHNIPLILV